MFKSFLFGLFHIPHVNFYKNSIKKLESMGHKCDIYVRNRGDLLPILNHELDSRKVIVIGDHQPSNFGKIIEVVSSSARLLLYLSQRKYDVVTSIAGLSLCYAASLRNIPTVTFTDDPEYNLSYKLYSRYSKRLIAPSFCKLDGTNTSSYHGYKELAHLHPNNFAPSISALEKYDLKPNNFVLIREQAPISLVYRDARVGQLYDIAQRIKDLGLNVILSLEDKSESHIYNGVGTILQEPVDSFHSLIYYARFVVSSGDSLSREAALLGTPSIYTGGRKMSVNKELINMKLIFKEENYEKIGKICDFLSRTEFKYLAFKKVEAMIKDNWIDTSRMITQELLDVSNLSTRKVLNEN